MAEPSMKPCPSCDHDAPQLDNWRTGPPDRPRWGVYVLCPECLMQGPAQVVHTIDDVDGCESMVAAQWNALPRAEEAE